MPPRNEDMHPGTQSVHPAVTQATHAQKQPPLQIVRTNVVYYILLHMAGFYALLQVPYAHPATWLAGFVMYVLGALGITAGAHRLWAHRTYKARLPVRIFLALCNSISFQNDVIEWARDHRMHHKHSETDADPHNVNRGFFFAHMGWLMVKKHPDVKSKGQDLNMDDLHNDSILRLQRKFYMPSVILLCFVLPTFVPWYYWGESPLRAFLTCFLLRYVISLNVTWCVNSVAHIWGNKPYDRHINPVENFFVSFGAIGEGFHNYHHTFPSDYSTSEHGWKVNFTTMFIDTLAAVGLVYDRKKMSYDSVFKRKQKHGDGSSMFGYVSDGNAVVSGDAEKEHSS